MNRPDDKKTRLHFIVLLLYVTVMMSSCSKYTFPPKEETAAESGDAAGNGIAVQNDAATAADDAAAYSDAAAGNGIAARDDAAALPAGMPEARQEFLNRLGDEDAEWRESIQNDRTGMFRLLITNSDIEIDPDLALEYAKAYITSDNPIYYIINPSLGTTTRINKLGNLIFVSRHEYTAGEENDVTLLSTGGVIREFILNTETGLCIADQ